MRYVLALVLLLGVASCGASSFEVKGALALSGDIHGMDGTDRDPGEGDACEGDSGYDDIAEGASVVIRDSKGDKVGLGSLGAGKSESGICIFRFKIPDVGGSGNVFSVEVSHRGEVSFKRSEASAVLLTLGD